MKECQFKSERIFQVIKEIPCEKLMLNQLAKEINDHLPKTYRLPSRSIAFLVSALEKQQRLIVCKEVICCQKFYTISINTIEQGIHEPEKQIPF
jgi:hypothetical protein